MLDMIISRAVSTFRVLGSRSRSLWLFSEKNCHRSTFIDGVLYNFIKMLGMMISRASSTVISQ